MGWLMGYGREGKGYNVVFNNVYSRVNIRGLYMSVCLPLYTMYLDISM